MLSGNGPICYLFRTLIFGCIFGAPLAPFWHPLGSTCHPVGFDWLPFGVLLLPSRLILAPLGALGITLPAVEPHFCQHFRLRWHQLAPKHDFGCLVSQNKCRHPQDFHTLGFLVVLDVLTTPSFLKIYLTAANFAKRLNAIDRNLHRRNSSFAERLTHLARCGILPQAT